MSNWKNNFKTSTYEDFMKTLFKDFDGNLKFFNRKATLENDHKVAELVLSTRGTSGQYEKIVATIIHKDNGTIASESFNFADYLMEGYEPNGHRQSPQVVDHCGKDWYMNGPTPKAIKNLMKRIREYLDLYL